MDKRIDRFKLCDLRFFPYLRGIIERLPEDVREDVLNDLISEDIVPLKNLELVESDNGRIPESLSNRMGMLAGILTAVKEANIR